MLRPPPLHNRRLRVVFAALIVAVLGGAALVCSPALLDADSQLRPDAAPLGRLKAHFGDWTGDTGTGTGTPEPVATAAAYLHLLVPATSANENLCKLLLSVTALGFPAPVFINWGDAEDPDPYVNHLAKVAGIRRYLERLPASRADDLVLVLDGFDTWLQLPPDVVISRYHDIIRAETQRVLARYGRELAEQHGMAPTIIFGPDKISWPEDPRRPALWAVPESPLGRWAFGPGTDAGRFPELNRPRWLNSGTIIGPVCDLLRLFAATAEHIARKDTDIISDQFHMANILGEQEVARMVLAGEDIELQATVWQSAGWEGGGEYVDIERDLPDLQPGGDYEFRLTIDYASRLFQTVAYYYESLAWVAYDGSTHAGELPAGKRPQLAGPWSSSAGRFELPADLARSPPPLAAFGRAVPPALNATDPSADARAAGLPIPAALAWRDLRLGTNAATGEVFAVLHNTPPKEYLEHWWHDMWFFPYGEAIIKNAPTVAPAQRLPYTTTADGRAWFAWVPDDNDDIAAEHVAGGGFDDREAYHSWHRLCSLHERVVFGNERTPEEAEAEPEPADEADAEAVA